MKRARYKRADEYACLAEEKTPSIKAKYIIAKSARLRCMYHRAKNYLNLILEEKPNHPDAIAELALIKRDQLREETSLKQVYSKVFNANSDPKPDNKKREEIKEINDRDIPVKFREFCKDFIQKFKDSSNQCIKTDPNMTFSAEMLLYFANLAENYDLDADLETDEDSGKQYLIFSKSNSN